MVRLREDDEAASEAESIPNSASVSDKARQLPVSRRALLWGLVGTGTATAAGLGIAAATRGAGPARRDPYPPVNPGPPTVRAPGTLAGPSAKPAWSAWTGVSAQAVVAAAGTVVVMDPGGALRGFDPRTGAAKWTSAARFFVNDSTPLLAVGGTVYGTDEHRDFLAVDASNGSTRWQFPFTSAASAIGTVVAAAGPLVFCSGGDGRADSQANGTNHGMLWAVDTAAHDTAWTVGNLAYSSAVAAPERESGLVSADVVVTADDTAYRLTAYSLKDQRVLWRKDVGAFGAYAAKSSPTDCIALSGNTVYWAANRLYALDAATGNVRWTAGGPGPDDVFQNVIVLPGLAPDGADLVVATAAGPNGGSLLAFLAASGAAAWAEHGGRLFGRQTAITAGVAASAGAGVLYTAEPDNGSVVAVDAKTGQTRWTYHDSRISSDLRWSIAADDARVYVAYRETLMAFEH